MAEFALSRRVLALCAGMALTLAAALPVWAAEYEAAEIERTGIVHELVPAVNDIIIHGERYAVSYTARIELGGNNYGAYSMLRPGMRVDFRYQLFDDGRKVIVFVRELLPNEGMIDA